MNLSQEFHPLKASSKVNATRTREEFVAGSSSGLPKIFPSSHSKESILAWWTCTWLDLLSQAVYHQNYRTQEQKLGKGESLPQIYQRQLIIKRQGNFFKAEAISRPSFHSYKSTLDAAFSLAVSCFC